MDVTWIQVFVLTLSECVAPAGKTVCQEQELEMQFLSRGECEVALQQLVSLKDQFDNTIVNRAASGCAPSARQTEAFASLDAARTASKAEDWRDPVADAAIAESAVTHEQRLENLKTCEESLGLAPCKQGDIIVEGGGNGHRVDIWRSDQ